MADSAEIAAQRTEVGLRRAGLEDPRPALRSLLRQLRARDQKAFEQATRKYAENLVPAIAAEDSDPVAEWLAYGRWLAGLLAPGHAVVIDGSGRARADPVEVSRGGLFLHLPDDQGEPALLLLAPTDPTAAQRETVRLLVG